MMTPKMSLPRPTSAPLGCALVLALCGWLSPALAQSQATPPSQTSEPDAANEPAPEAQRAGQATQRWVAAQAQRQQASRIRQTQSGAVMSRVYKRYVDGYPLTSEDTSFHDVKLGSTTRDRKSTRLNSSHSQQSRMPSSA